MNFEDFKKEFDTLMANTTDAELIKELRNMGYKIDEPPIPHSYTKIAPTSYFTSPFQPKISGLTVQEFIHDGTKGRLTMSEPMEIWEVGQYLMGN